MPSRFAEFLSEMIGAVSGCLGAVIQDWDGETVDYFGHIEEQELMINAAQWGLMWRMFKYGFDKPTVKNAKEILIQTEKQKIIIQSLFSDYYLVVILERDASLHSAQCYMEHMVEDIKEEMGL
ncbi:hypothetical protein KKF84_21345 [Myxococcota bacterium]|nr:hypothetical protein [Myxococcota bacterium]MBU1537872.1 hypothetical protein [Myxococcota bacterium]